MRANWSWKHGHSRCFIPSTDHRETNLEKRDKGLACSVMNEEEVAFRNLYTRSEGREDREPEKEESQFKDLKMAKDIESWVLNGKEIGSTPGALQASCPLQTASHWPAGSS